MDINIAFAELELKIRAIDFALASFADFDDEGERRRHLKEHRESMPELAPYVVYSLAELKEEKRERERYLHEERMQRDRQLHERELAKSKSPLLFIVLPDL